MERPRPQGLIPILLTPPLGTPPDPSLLDEFPSEGLKLPSGCGCSQQQIQTLPGEHVAQDPQQPLWGLGVVCIHRLGTRQEIKS